jgi:hypothetical protein
MSALAAPPTTREALRERAEALLHELQTQLRPYEAPGGRKLRTDELSRKRRVAGRQQWFERLRAEVLQMARSDAWRSHDLAVELLLTLEDMRSAIERDPDALDEDWKVREAMKLMEVVLMAMLRQLDHEAIDDPVVAAKFVTEQLATVETGEVARLLGVTTKSVSNWRRGRVEQIKRNPARITLIGQLVYEVRNSTTPRGIVLWFDRSREQFGGRTPLELIDEDVADAAGMLIPLARGGRAQLGG